MVPGWCLDEQKVMDRHMKSLYEMSCLTFPHADIRMETAKLVLVAFGGEHALDESGFVEVRR